MNNECSTELKSALGNEQVALQLVPARNHQMNAAERVIQTPKTHLKVGLASVYPNFPIEEWDRLLSQSEITLHLLRAAIINPTLSAHAHMNGQFGYNKTPLAPGTNVVANEPPEKSLLGTKWRRRIDDRAIY